jgi:hypothetical protein
MLGGLSPEEEEKAMTSLVELVTYSERTDSVADDGGLDAATLAFIHETGGVVAS